MTAAREFAKLKALVESPPEDDGSWFGRGRDGVDYLIQNARSEHVVIYASGRTVLIHGVLAPSANVTPPDVDDLLRTQFGLDDAWAVQKAYGGVEGYRMTLEAPMDTPGCKSLIGSEKLIFRRSFHGLDGYKPPTEISQKVVHALGLHFLESRNAYCRLDENGDLEDVITLFEEATDDPWNTVRAVLIRAEDLTKFMALSETVLFRKFDFTRTHRGGMAGWDDASQKSHRAPDLAYHYGFGGSASFANGYQIARPTFTRADLEAEWRASEETPKQYETFKIQDWKNGVLVECNANPNCTSNYFTKSDKPFETSPAFFKPEVLHKYKSDPEKYTIEHRSITCRNSWHLKTYDVNEEGQVHTYIGYLANLPYSEQQYWKLYNEWPKAPISNRAFQTDFEGNFSTEPDPLSHISHAIDEVERLKASWWSARGSARPKVLYPASTSSKDWGDEILALDQLLVEGFYAKGLRALAKTLNVTLEPDWASLKIVEACLAGAHVPADEAKGIIEPLRELHHLRSKVKGHATAERKRLEDAALTKYGSFRSHFFELAKRCAASFDAIVSTLRVFG